MSHSFTNNIFHPDTRELLYTKCTQCGGRGDDPAVRDVPCPRAPAKPPAALQIRINNILRQDSYNGTSKTFVVHNLQHAGLVDDTASGDMKLFMRQEAKKLWKDLNSLKPNSIAIIQGCPGVGKSVLVFASAIHHCMTKKQSLLYFHSDSSYSRCLLMDRDGNVDSVDGVDFPAFVVRNRVNYDVTVLDGTHENKDVINVHRNFPSDKQLIICTSYQALRLNQEARSKEMSRRKFYTVISWTLEEYLEAAKARCFSFLEGEDEETVDRIVRTRFKIAGGSIRLFVFGPEQAIEAIRVSLESVKDYQLLYRNQVGDKSDSAVNGVMALYRSDDNNIYSIPLSQYVLERLGDLCKEKNDIIDFILKARASLPNNPSWQGWVTEYEVISIIKLYGKLTVHNDVNGKRKPKELSCSEVIEMKENETLKPCNDYRANQWIIPFKWNQALWDAIQILPRNVLGLRQITNAEMYVNKFQHLQSLLNATNANGVQYLIICKRNNFEGFKAINRNFDETNWNIPVALETVWYEELSKNDKDVEASPFKKRKV